MKTVFEVRYYTQTLIEGTWNSTDSSWEWDTSSDTFDDLESAEKKFSESKPTNNTPVISLYKVFLDKYGHEEDSELLDEKNA